MQSAVIDIQRGKADLDPYGPYGAAGSLAQASSMELGSLDRGFMDCLGSAPLEQELDIRITLGVTPVPSAAQAMPPIPQLAQQPAMVLPAWQPAAGARLGLPPPAVQAWDSGEAMETSYRLPEPAWDSSSARSASVMGPDVVPTDSVRPLSPEGSSQDGGEATRLGSGHSGLGSPPGDGMTAPSAIALPAPAPNGNWSGGANAPPPAKQAGALANALTRDLVAKLAAGTAPHKPQKSRSSRAQKASHRGKPKVCVGKRPCGPFAGTCPPAEHHVSLRFGADTPHDNDDRGPQACRVETGSRGATSTAIRPTFAGSGEDR